MHATTEDQVEFEELYPYLLRFAHSLVIADPAVEPADLVQRAYIKGWGVASSPSCPTLRHQRAYLLSVILNATRDYGRKQTAHGAVRLTDTLSARLTSPDQGLPYVVDEDDLLTSTLQAISRSADPQFYGCALQKGLEVAVMRAMGYHDREIAQQLGLTARGVRTRIWRMRDLLREKIADGDQNILATLQSLLSFYTPEPG